MTQPANKAWLQLLERIVTEGDQRSPRGLPTKEILCCQTVIDMREPVLTVKNRKLGYRFLAAEAWWILSGKNTVYDIAPYSKMIPKFSDDGITFFGAYGPKIVDQLPYVARCLLDDPESRQAVITIWREKPGPTKDVPCTVSLQWFIRDGKIHCSVYMRSSDAWLGVPYDWFNFSMTTVYLLAYMSQASLSRGKPLEVIELGNLYFTAGSQHLYETHWDSAEMCVFDPREEFEYAALTPDQYRDDPYLWLDHLKAVADRDVGDLIYPFLHELVSHREVDPKDDTEEKPRGY